MGNNKISNDQATSDEVAISTETVEAAVEAAVAAISETSDSVTSGGRSANGTTTGSYENSSSSRDRITQHYLHPLGIQSSASCPDHTIMNGDYNGDYGYTQHQYTAMSVPIAQQHEHQGLCSVDLNKALERSVAAPFTAANDPHRATSTTNQHISSLAANFMLAQSGNSVVAAAAAARAGGGSTPSVTATNAAITQQQQPCTITSSSNNKAIITSSNNKNNKSKKKGHASRQSRAKSSTKRRKKSDSTSATAVSSSSLPPFYLFDAPVELRANFMQNQRRLGLPIQNDPNSYHYGETVNGFHPHQYQLPVGDTASTTTTTSGGLPSSMGSATGTATATGSSKHVPKLIDARHGNSNRKNKGGQVKNEREQKRALKITELIEQLRLQMEDGGWQVEARSKFHTLHNCAEYVNHMIASTSEKEKKNEKLKSDLEEKQRQIERENEEKAMLEGRSDPESVTSCLTSDTTLSSSRHQEAEERNAGGDNNNSNNKRKLSINNREGGSSRDTNNKKLCTVSSEATSGESSGEDRGGSSGSGRGGGPNVHGCSISKTISTVSDITDSNRGSSSNSSGSGSGSSDDVPTEQDSPSGNDDDGEQPSTSTISSDAAVASEKTSRDRDSCHMDVVFNNDKRMGRKRPPEEVTSLERSFELNYEEVFNKSNIPQLIANTSGKIVTWNECFAKATGYRKSEIERMTIFSLVKPENLANFFEIVAAALRPPDEVMEINNYENHHDIATEDQSKKNSSEKNDYGPTKGTVSSSQGSDECATTTTVNECSKEKEKGVDGNPKEDIKMNIDEEKITMTEGKQRDDDLEKSAKEETTVNSTEEMKKEENEAIPKHLLDYTAMTLPCIDFPAMRKRNQAAADSDSIAIPPLHLTVTLMADNDPKRRCFHCVFTNSKGTNGSLGIITPELLASLFSRPLRRRKKHHSSHGHQRKRARGSTERHCVKQISNEQPETPPSPLLMPPPHCDVQMKEEDSSKTNEFEDVVTERPINDIYIR